MNVVITRQELTALILKIQSTVAAKPAIPILANILLEASEDKLVLRATDLTVSTQFSAPATVVEQGKIALPARRFFQLIRELRSPKITIITENQQTAKIIAGSSVFKINGMHYSEFPHFPKFNPTQTVTLTASQLKQLLHRSVFCAAREDSRYVLNGVCVEITGKDMTFTGTDGKRLARMKQEIPGNTAQEGSYILPLKCVEEMLRILDSSEDEVQMSLFEDKASFEVGSGILITKLLSGQYPDVQKVIPNKCTHHVQLHREELLSLLKQVSLFTSEHSHSVRFIFEQGELTLKAMASNIGEGVVSMPVDFANNRLEIAFNPRYFIEMLRHSTDDCVTFSIKDPFNPALITDSKPIQFVIMPMRLEEPQEESGQNSVSAKAAIT